MRRKIRAIVKKPGEPIGHKITLDNNLRAFQEVVGGPIETVTFLQGVTVIRNGEGRNRDLPENFRMMSETIHGAVAVVGVYGENFTNCPLNMETWKLILQTWGNET